MTLDQKTAAYLRDRARQVEAVHAKGRITASEASQMARLLRVVADEIEQGMHR